MELGLSKSNQKGFVLILFLTLLPLLVIALSGLAMILAQIQWQMETRHACRDTLFQTQKQVGQNLSLLMKLNPAAKALRGELAGLQKALIAAGGPETPMGAAIAAQILEVEAQKTVLGGEQKALLTAMATEMRTGSLMSELRVRAVLRQRQARSVKILSLDPGDVSSSRPHLAVRPDDPSDSAPIYELEMPFTEKQSLQTFWKVTETWNIRQWIKKNLHWRQISFNESCRASLQTGGGGFRPVLNEDRFSSRPWSF
jgi:hypothetical protein